MRKNLLRNICTAVLATAVLAGCSVKVGTKPAPPPPPPPKAEPAPAPKPKPKLKMKAGVFKGADKDGKIDLPGPVMFHSGTANLKPESDAVLQVVFDYLKGTPNVTKLRVEGHTDTDGDDASNLILSQARAMAASKWLIDKGTACERLVPVGFGETRLRVDPETSADDKATNRRVDFLTAESKGKAFGSGIEGGGNVAGKLCP